MESAFFALAHDMWCATTPDGSCERVNPAWTRVLGWEVAQVEGQSFRAFVHPDDRDAVDALLDRLTRGPVEASSVIRLRAVDGSYRLIDWRIAADDLSGEVIAAGRDVTDQVAMQDRLAAREVALAGLVAQQSRDMEDMLGRLGDDIHDGAIQHMVAALMFLEAGPGNLAFTSDALVQIRLTLKAMRRIMNGLDAVAEDLDDPHSTFRAIAAGVAEQFGADISCEVVGSAALTEGVGRTACRIAREGLVNACKHASRGQIHLSVRLSTDAMTLDVRDPGCADAPVDAEHGSGYGLRVLDARVRSHGGTLALSTSSSGSTLAAELPLHVSNPAGPALPGRPDKPRAEARP